MFDTLFSGGTVYDGEGNPPVRQDVGVRDGRLVAIGDLSAATARRRLDLTGLAVAPDGALADQLFSLSGYGWAARFLQHYVRERQVLSLGEAIRRITSLPASRLGLHDRGRLKVDQWADVTVFNPDQIESRFTASQPRVYPGGIVHVMVNGELAMHDGSRTGCQAGRVLRDFRA